MDFETGINRLKNNQYPGRGIIIGKSQDESKWFQVYWIMGRSEQSRNRIFVKEGDIVYTKVYDETKVINPELLIYPAVKVVGSNHIVTNGSHTNTIEDSLKNGKSVFDAIFTETYEPDPPHYTPRISGVLDINDGSFIISIVKHNKGNPLREFFCYQNCKAGIGYCIHTYNGEGNPLPSFIGEPFEVPLFNKINEVLDFYWNLLNEENRISLLVKEINIQEKSFNLILKNKNPA
ncbi:MAG: IMP cyclohydrolase [Brevinematales bacterium]|nr:IMP cyclohydrolase [Brevinematales bacterium]